MTVGELDRWALERNWGTPRRARLARPLQKFAVLYADRNLCGWWAAVSDGARRNGRPIASSDAWVAATARAVGVALVTNNPADYAGVVGLTVLTAATV